MIHQGLSDVVPLKNPVMPVFGVAHGNSQAAFVAYAESGAEYMDILVSKQPALGICHNKVNPNRYGIIENLILRQYTLFYQMLQNTSTHGIWISARHGFCRKMHR
mgnify:CR=1 FL=1